MEKIEKRRRDGREKEHECDSPIHTALLGPGGCTKAPGASLYQSRTNEKLKEEE